MAMKFEELEKDKEYDLKSLYIIYVNRFKSKSGLRSFLNMAVKDNKLLRVKRGVYKLMED